MRRLLALAALPLLSACSAPRTVDSCILVVVDTLRADRLGTYGYARDTSPELDRWAQRGVVFEEAFSTAPWTLPAFGTLFTGQLPSHHQAGILVRPWRRAQLPRWIPTLAELAAREGLATAGFVSNPHLDQRISRIGKGFEVWDNAIDGTQFHPGRPMSEFRSADQAVDSALGWLAERRRERFLLVVHLLEPHWPQRPPAEHFERFAGREARELLALADVEFAQTKSERLAAPDPAVREGFRRGINDLYDAEVSFVDDQIGRFLDALGETGVLDRSLVLFTADHGEELLERGEYDHGHSFFDELLRVPLIAWAPGVQPGRRGTAVSLLDVMPTVLDALQIEPPPSLPGLSLWPALRHREELPERHLLADGTSSDPWDFAVIGPRYKLIVHEKATAFRLYDRRADPGERVDVALREPREVRSLLRSARAALAEQRGGVAVEYPPDLVEKLRALGYLGATGDETE